MDRRDLKVAIEARLDELEADHDCPALDALREVVERFRLLDGPAVYESSVLAAACKPLGIELGAGDV